MCQLSYQYILRYDSLEADWQQFLRDVGIEEGLELAWSNQSGGGDYSDYYKDIRDRDIIKLYQKFESDFLMFGYTLEGYLHEKPSWSHFLKFFPFYLFGSVVLCKMSDPLSSLENLKYTFLKFDVQILQVFPQI